MIYISWGHKNNVLLIENTNNLSNKTNTSPPENTHSIYKNIEEAPNLDYLLFRKD